MNAAPVMADAFGLVSVMVSTEATPVPTAAGVKLFATAGWPSTVRVELAPAEEPALVVVTAPVELLYTPAMALVTFTVTVHEPLAGIVPPESATLVPLLAAVTVPAPHVVVAPLAAAVLTRPAG